MKKFPEEFDDLDNPTTYAVDPSGVYGWIARWDKQLDEGAKKYIGRIDLPTEGNASIREVIVCGMGGSAIAGDVAYAAIREMLPVPYRVIRGYTQPASLGENTLQIVVSYSGNTEEAIWAYTQGHNRGANIVAVCSGGALMEMSERHGRVVVRIPEDCLAPRMALGYLLPAVLGVLDAAFEDVGQLEKMLEESVTALRRGLLKYERDLPFEKNFAKRLAFDIHETFPVVVASELTWSAALRFHAQLNENAKWLCHASKLPEMNHNEIVAYAQPGSATKQIGIIMLRDKDDHPRVQFRQDFTMDAVDGTVAWIRQLKGEGKNPLARLLSLIQTADFTSYYLACARGLDPKDIRAIDDLKDKLGKVK